MKRIAVIGAGLVGAALAERLSRSATRVVLLDAARPGSGTSSSSFAWLNSNNKRPRAYHDLNVSGMREHRIFAAEAAAAPWLHGGGNIEWVEDEAAATALYDKARRLHEWGYAVELVDAPALQGLEPELRLDTERIRAAAFYPEEAWIDPPQLISTLLARFAARGGVLREGVRVATVIAAGGRVAGVLTDAGERIAFETVVICAGTASTQVAAPLGFELPLANTAGLLALTQPARTALNRIVHAPGINLRPAGDGRVLLHDESIDATIDVGTSPSLDLPGCGELRRRAQALLPSLRDTRLQRARIGVRPIPADGLTAAGPVPGVDGAYLCVTHSGATLCLTLARLLSHAILDGALPPALAPFAPARFSSAGPRSDSTIG